MFKHILFVEEDNYGKLTIINNYTISENFLGLIFISGFDKLYHFTIVDFMCFMILSILFIFIYLIIDEQIKIQKLKYNIKTTIQMLEFVKAELETIRTQLDSITKLNKNKIFDN